MNIEKERWITHYCSSHKILLVGEGDFSFSACLARAFGSAKNMVATSLDSEDVLKVKHWSSVPHLTELSDRGCLVLHGIDADDMHENHILRNISFDRIIFNFPHAGHEPGLCERSSVLINRHKDLMKAFFHSASKIISDCGEVHVAHHNDSPYNRWKIQKLAKKSGLVMSETVEFYKMDYPGYHNKRGGEIKANKTFPLKPTSFTFKFKLEDHRQAASEGTNSEDTADEILLASIRSWCINA